MAFVNQLSCEQFSLEINISSCTAVVRKIVKWGLEKTRFDSTIVLEFLNKLLQINIGKTLLLYARRNIGFAINEALNWLTRLFANKTSLHKIYKK